MINFIKNLFSFKKEKDNINKIFDTMILKVDSQLKNEKELLEKIRDAKLTLSQIK